MNSHSSESAGKNYNGQNLFYISLAFAIPFLLCFIPVFLIFKRFITSWLLLDLAAILLVPVCAGLTVCLIVTAVIAIVHMLRRRSKADKAGIKYYKYITILTVALLSSALLAWNLSPAIPRERELQAIVDRIHAGEHISPFGRTDMFIFSGGIPGREFVRFTGFFGGDYFYFDRTFYAQHRPELTIDRINFGDRVVTSYRHIHGNWYYVWVR